MNKTEKKKMGRPLIGKEPRVKYSVRMEPSEFQAIVAKWGSLANFIRTVVGVEMDNIKEGTCSLFAYKNSKTGNIWLSPFKNLDYVRAPEFDVIKEGE